MCKTLQEKAENYVSEHIDEGHALPSQLEAAFCAGFAAAQVDRDIQIAALLCAIDDLKRVAEGLRKNDE